MNLIYFTKDAYKLLKKDLVNNKGNYYSEDPWLEEYFASAGIDEYYNDNYDPEDDQNNFYKYLNL